MQAKKRKNYTREFKIETVKLATSADANAAEVARVGTGRPCVHALRTRSCCGTLLTQPLGVASTHCANSLLTGGDIMGREHFKVPHGEEGPLKYCPTCRATTHVQFSQQFMQNTISPVQPLTQDVSVTGEKLPCVHALRWRSFYGTLHQYAADAGPLV